MAAALAPPAARWCVWVLACAAGVACTTEPPGRGPRRDAFAGCASADGDVGGDEDGGAPADAGQVPAPGGALAVGGPGGPNGAAGTQPPALDPAPGVPVPGRPRPKLLLVSIDGLRPDAISEAPAPNIMQLACTGSFSWNAQTVTPSITLPSHASMVSGFPPDVHGLLWNDWRPGYIPVPTVFSAAHAAGLRTVMVVGKEKLQQLAIPGTVDTYVFAPGGEEDVAVNALAEIRRGFDLMMVHFPMVDLTGHAYQWMSDVYLRQVAATDAALGRVLAALPSGTVVIVTADHGGRGYTHWGGGPEDFTIPWVAHGPGIRRGHTVAAPIKTEDTAATIVHLLGLRLPPDAIGRPVLDALAR